MRFFVLLLVCFLAKAVVAQQDSSDEVKITPIVGTLAESRQKHLDALRKYVDVLERKYKDGSRPLQDLIGTGSHVKSNPLKFQQFLGCR